ncbi:hypothetical protein EDEG_02393 [Edhazardia aedis USNM 41457]|uniref:Ricin B lectin domain-containing protein n=1 Tax=Edhazardia aedis (strain USNM 41457) TaxID=1003232 RepID=J9DKV6_EDHAE|nr:hypothetical protein EDEG_02393 [Edhazardia aedis USNM 41457]|eukprot:EJW03225.1 hypothetical protein EDEG_02393 [Edhazardia aedis USNM 41457]
MMIVFLFSLTYAIIPGKKYYIETYDMPYKRININSGSVRATTPENLEKFSSKNKIKTQLRFVAEKPFKAGKEVFLIEYENKKYIVSKGPEKFGVVTGDDKSEYRFWSIVESVKAPNTYNIKNDKKCLSFLDANTDDKGHFVQIRKCDNKNGQLFRFVDVEEAEKSTSELDGENKENEKIEKASNDEIEKEKALSELEKNKEKDLEKKMLKTKPEKKPKELMKKIWKISFLKKKRRKIG